MWFTLVNQKKKADISSVQDYLCRSCSSAVTDSDKAILCDLCQTWVHVSCDPSISEAELVKFNSDEPYVPCVRARLKVIVSSARVISRQIV